MPVPGALVSTQWLADHLGGDDFGSLVCSIPAKEFSGKAPVRRRAGHIPGSVSVPAAELVDPETRRLLEPGLLAERLAPVATGERVILYCAAGIAATSGALALAVLGHTHVAVYDGSLNEWSADRDAALTSG